MDKKKNTRQFSLSALVFPSLLVIGLIPLALFFFFIKQEIVSELSLLEEEQRIYLMEGELDALKDKIDSYKNMIGFVSQLPAVMEILDEGSQLEGAIEQNVAFKRYTGVLSRAFKQNNDVVSIHILDANAEVRYSLKKDVDTAMYKIVENNIDDHGTEFIEATLQMKDKGYILTPLILSDNNNDKSASPRLLLRIFTPIIIKQKLVGVFCSDIDIGLLTLEFPHINWVLNDGTCLFDGKDVFSEFSGLSAIFQSGKPGILRDNGTGVITAWIPFQKGKAGSLNLWAGKEIVLNTVKNTQETLFFNIFKYFILLVLGIFLVSYLISRYTKNIFERFLIQIREAVLHHKVSTGGEKSKIKELSDFSENLDLILNENLQLEQERKKNLEELQEALDEVKNLREILPICSFCKKIRNDDGYYEQLESYLRINSGVDFSHTVCPTCMEKHYPSDLAKKRFSKGA